MMDKTIQRITEKTKRTEIIDKIARIRAKRRAIIKRICKTIQEKKRLKKELGELESQIETTEGKL